MLLTALEGRFLLQALEVLGERSWAFEEPLKLQLRALGHGAGPSLSSLDGAGPQTFLL